MSISYEWDVETYDCDANEHEAEILYHNHSDQLKTLPWLLNKNERLVLVRTVENGDRQWAYVDESKMLPKYFSIPQADGKYYETQIKIPQRFHREIAKIACGN